MYSNTSHIELWYLRSSSSCCWWIKQLIMDFLWRASAASPGGGIESLDTMIPNWFLRGWSPPEDNARELQESVASGSVVSDDSKVIGGGGLLIRPPTRVGPFISPLPPPTLLMGSIAANCTHFSFRDHTCWRGRRRKRRRNASLSVVSSFSSCSLCLCVPSSEEAPW